MDKSNLTKEMVAVEDKTTNNAVETSNGNEVKENTVGDNKSFETEQAENECPTETEDATSTETNSKNTETEGVETKDTNEKPLELKYLDKDFIYDVLSVPTYSHSEYRMVTFIIMWARENNIKYEFDDYGNIYLTKGELAEGEFYPCVTSHLDTVQSAQEAYAQCGLPLKLLERVNIKKQHELYVQGMGIGADDKAGVLISLSLFKYAEKLKACFFLEEEVGCCGSKKLNKQWFENVGYVIGWDSPDRNRAAYACSGELLMSKALFKEIEETCKTHGVTDFRSEPFTDVKEIRLQTQIQCMNFGNGGYNAHAITEYVVLEDMDGACGLGVALLEKLGRRLFKMSNKTCTYNYYGTDEDILFFAKNTAYSTYTPSTTTYRNQGTTKSTIPSTTTSTTPKSEDKVNSTVLEYVVERYEKYITDIQEKVEQREETLLLGIKKLCQEKGLDYADFLDLFVQNPSTDAFSTAIEF